jgi:hypothetical protein
MLLTIPRRRCETRRVWIRFRWIVAARFRRAGPGHPAGRATLRIDLMTGMSGLSWNGVVAGAIRADLDEVPVRFISRRQFVINKRASGRKKDLPISRLLEKTHLNFRTAAHNRADPPIPNPIRAESTFPPCSSAPGIRSSSSGPH